MIDSTKPEAKKAVNVGVQRVAVLYAKALLGAAEKAGQTDAVAAELSALAGVLADNPKLEELLASALIPHDEKVKILDRLFGNQVSPLLLDFLKVLSERGRLEVTRAVDRELQLLYDQLRGRVRVQLRTAVPLEAGTARQLEDSLSRILGGQPQVEPSVDPELIGGVVLRVGDTVYDGSVARQLRQAREQMITRSIHEIQSRRDRFRHSGGN
jgi:F-type H+-transporting ATPase subunit delta